MKRLLKTLKTRRTIQANSKWWKQYSRLVKEAGKNGWRFSNSNGNSSKQVEWKIRKFENSIINLTEVSALFNK
jgi:hypothetical protein